MCWKDSRKPAYSIFPCKNLGMPAHEMIPLLENKSDFLTECFFKKLTVVKNSLISENAEKDADVWKDYPPNWFAWPILSEKMKQLIESNLTGQEGIDFITVKVSHYSVSRLYYILRFNRKIECLDKAKSMYAPSTDFLIRPVFRGDFLDQYHTLGRPEGHDLWKITSEIYVTEEIRKAIIKAKIQNVEFSPMKVTKNGCDLLGMSDFVL